MQSTLYPKCPKCRENGLFQEIQGRYFCANCNFDYLTLKDDKVKLDEFLVEQMKEGTMGQLSAIAIHRVITLIPHQESVNYIKELAFKNGIKLPEPKKGMCFIATACYEDADAIEVFVLRLFRDKYLLKSIAGKLFVDTYYIISPPVALLLSKTSKLKKIIRNYLLYPLYRFALKKLTEDVQE